MLKTSTLSQYTIAELKTICQALNIKRKCRRKNDYIDALSTKTPLEFLNILSDIPTAYIDKVCPQYNHRNPFYSSSIPAFQTLEFLYELWDMDFRPIALLILLKNKLQLSDDPTIDTTLLREYLTTNDIVEIYTRHELNIDLESVNDLLRLMNSAGYKEIKAENVAVLKAKQIFGFELSMKEKMETKFNPLFESNDLAYVQQGTSLLESLYSIEDICDFFGFEFSTIFSPGLAINAQQRYDDPRLLELLMSRYENPEVIGYLYLWLVGLVYSERPECVSFQGNRLSFFFEESFHTLPTCFIDGYFYVYDESDNRKKGRCKYVFTSIPESIFKIASIESLVLPQEMEQVPAAFLCMTNLRYLAIIGCPSTIHCTDYDALQASNIELVIIEEMDAIPDFIWHLPKLKHLMVREYTGDFTPLFNNSIEELKLHLERSRTISIDNLTNLKRLKLEKPYAFDSASHSLTHLTIEACNTVTLGTMPNLRYFNSTFYSKTPQLTIESIPKIEEFHVYGYGKDNLEDTLLKASNATSLTFSSNALEVPSELVTWPNLETVNFSQWSKNVQFPTEFRTWNIKKIVCNYEQIGSENFPEQVQDIMCSVSDRHPPKDRSGLNRLTKLTRLRFYGGRSIDSYLEEIFQCTSLQYLDLSRCYISQLPDSIKALSNLLALELQDNNSIPCLPHDIGSLKSLRYLNIEDTAIRSLPPSINQCTDLQKIVLPKFPNPLEYRSLLGKPYIRHGKIYFGPQISSFLPDIHLRAFFLYLKDNPTFGKDIEVLHIDPRAIIRPSKRDTMFTTSKLNVPHVFMYPDIDFALLPNLRHLSICRIEGDLPQLPTSIQLLQKLESIDISHNGSLTVSEWLFKLPNLKEIYAYGVFPFIEHDHYLSMAEKHGVTLHIQARSGL